MKRLTGMVLSCLLVGSPVLAETIRERVRSAASVIYIHGMNEELARQQVGPEGVPYLMELLADRDFERRDNVVAFLAYLATDRETEGLVRFFENPMLSSERPEEYRAWLLVPEALGRMALRGGVEARFALDAMRADPRNRAKRGLDKMIDHGLRLATDTLLDGGQSYPVDGGGGAGSGSSASPDPGPTSTDPNPSIHRLNITHGFSQVLPTYANHVDAASPINDATVDALLASASLTMATDSTVGGTTDRACCVTLNRSGAGTTFGTPGDGLDVISSSGELSIVLNNSKGRMHVVDAIEYCGGPGTNIIGCAGVPGDGTAVVRIGGGALFEGILWAHEFGHNVGLSHNPSSGYIMSPGLSGSSIRLTQGDCDGYHSPSASANITPVVTGVCQDTDNDLIMSSADNCPTVPNSSQANGDTDTWGDSCDNCRLVANQDQANCDGDHFGDVCDASSPVPAVIDPILFSTAIRLEWPSVSVQKRIYRGGFAAPPFVYNHVLIATVSTSTQFYEDTDVPAVSTGFYYLVMGLNDCGEGP